MKIEMGELCEEIVEEIISRLPISSLVKCKNVSKLWSSLVCKLYCQREPTVGLINLHLDTLMILDPSVKEEDEEEEEEEHDKEEDGEEEERMEGREYLKVIDSFTLCLRSEFLASSNGLLLCSSASGVYYVGNPILNQWAALPQSPCRHSSTMVFDIGFAFDGHHYKLVRFSWRTATLANGIHCEIFSSETGQWREHQAAILNTLRLGSIEKRSLYWKGVIHWTLGIDVYLLMFYLEKEVFKLIKLPINHETGNKCLCLWESKGCLYYCNEDAAKDKVHMWTYIDGDDDNDEKQGDTENKQKWVHVRTIMHRVRILYPLHIYSDSDSDSDSNEYAYETVVPCGFNHDLEVVYLRTRLSIVSHSFKTGRQTEVWSYRSKRRRSEGRIMLRGGNKLLGNFYPYVSNLVDLPTWDGCKLLEYPHELLEPPYPSPLL